MIELIEGMPDGVVGLEAKGEVTGEDYERVLIPAVERAHESNTKLSLFYVLGGEFDGYTASAMWDDAKVGLEHYFSWERIALVTDHDLYRRLIRGVGFLLPAKVKIFELAQLEEAKSWVATSG